MLACTFGDCRRSQYPVALLRCKFDAPSACCGVVDSLDDKEVIEESDEMSRIEDKSEIDYLLNVLSPEQREAVILRFGEELSYREIALVTGCNMRTAQSRVRVSKADLGRSRESCMYDGSYFPGGASSKFIWGNRADGFILPGSLFSLHGEYTVPVPA